MFSITEQGENRVDIPSRCHDSNYQPTTSACQFGIVATTSKIIVRSPKPSRERCHPRVALHLPRGACWFMPILSVSGSDSSQDARRLHVGDLPGSNVIYPRQVPCSKLPIGSGRSINFGGFRLSRALLILLTGTWHLQGFTNSRVWRPHSQVLGSTIVRVGLVKTLVK